MTSSQHGLYVQGYTRATMDGTEGCNTARWSQSLTTLSSDCRLQFACMKVELLVIADQLRRGECVLGSCTHRPSHHESWWRQKSLV
jgi:hypothetical protein